VKAYFSHGKLLITGEYVVLDGAIALAIPTKFGQSLTVESILEPKIIWQSLDEKGQVWFEDEFFFNQSGAILSQTTHVETSQRLIQILETARQLNPEFLMPQSGVKVITKLDFPIDWGLGTSSSLINNIANWAEIDAYTLLDKTFGGSGYDIAIAQKNSALTYQIINHSRTIKCIPFEPTFKDCIYFVHLNKKQNSRDGISKYRTNDSALTNQISKINAITSKILNFYSLSEFELLIEQHETIISKLLNQKPIKDILFNDFEGSIKSLGAWGGDFILVTSKHNPTAYFNSKGYTTVISFNDMIYY